MTTTARLANRLVQAALRLHAKQLWLEFEDDDAVVLEIPHHDQPLAACIYGQSGKEFGITLFRDGLAGMDRFFTSVNLEDSTETADQLSLAVSPLREVPPPLRGLLEEARWRGRREALAPHLMIIRPGMQPRNPRKNEIRTMLYAVSAILAADDAGDLDPRTYDAPGGVQLLRLAGSPEAPSYEIGETEFERPDQTDAEESRQLAQADYARDDGAWSLGVFTLPAAIEGDERIIRSLMVVECDTGKIIHHDLLFGSDMESGAASLLRYVEETEKLPREIYCLNRDLFVLLLPAFEAHGVACLHEPDQPGLEAVAATLSDRLAGIDPATDDDDLEKWLPWEHAQNEFIVLMAKVAREREPDRNRALARYFGSARRGAELIEAYDDDDYLLLPFSVWLFLLYRTRKGAKTIIERTLKRRDLSAEQRAVGEAMRAAAPSLYRIESIDPPNVTLLDLAGGGQAQVRDASLARSASDGLVLPAVVFPVGPYSFISMVGPAIAPMHAMEAFSYLESQGIEATADGLAAHPHFGGRLAEWMERIPDRMPQLQTTDGEALVMHTADFAMDDPRGAAAALEARPDIEFDEHDASYVWLSEEDPDRRPDQILLGRMEILDDHLVLTCNSAERFARAREFLEKIRGVRFVGVRTSDLDLGGTGGAIPGDDLPGIDAQAPGSFGGLDQNNLPPEIAKQISVMFAEMQIRWLDEQIPMFGGRTPREMCATPEGSRQVAFQIRAMPKPHPSISAEMHERIRLDMFRELGLDTLEL